MVAMSVRVQTRGNSFPFCVVCRNFCYLLFYFICMSDFLLCISLTLYYLKVGFDEIRTLLTILFLNLREGTDELILYR